jgi:hypothetical protein
MIRATIALGIGLLAALPALAADADPEAAQQAAAAKLPADPLKQAYFGELHLHTSFSLDSYIFGNRNDRDAAYRFAQGEAVTLFGGQRRQLKRPLDFVAITDHGEFLGEEALCTTPGTAEFASDICKAMRAEDMRQFYKIASSVTFRKRVPELCGEDGKRCHDAAGATWRGAREAAIKYYRPGKFTTLVGYEYSPNIPAPFSQAGGGFGMLHRNVIFRTTTVPDNVFTAYDGPGEEMMKWLETACREPCRALSIPHNSNMSWGRFFWEKNSDGSPWTQDILERRLRVEPLVEIFQIKGSSECQAGVGLADEECRFEPVLEPCKDGQTDGCAGPDSFVRDAIVKGLRVEKERGVNPFKYGFIGSTDSHNGNPGATEEDDFKGHLAQQDYTPELRVSLQAGQNAEDDGDGHGGAMFRFNPGGLAGVWAEKNTREAIWDALARRETFGTSGTRIRVRFFAGYGYPEDLHRRPDLVKVGYEKGVPMGGDLKAAPGGAAPRFVVWATRDPDSAPLQKIQIVKGWVDADGTSRSRTMDVACADGMVPDAKSGLCPDNGATVDPQSCKPVPGKGAGELAASWSDPAFDARQRAVYYVRVLEDPVCRWSTYDAKRLKATLPKSAPATIKERAWSSPIWYVPAG